MNKQRWTLVSGISVGAGLRYLGAQHGAHGLIRSDEDSSPQRERSLPPTTRLLLGVVGGALCATALQQRRPILNLALGTAGLAVLARGLTSPGIPQFMRFSAVNRAVILHKSIDINVPVAEIFRFLVNFENFPFFMANVLEVRPYPNDRRLSHWVVRGPSGTYLEWDTEIIRIKPNRLISWKTLPGAVVQSAGIGHFNPNSGGGTRLEIHLTYNPPAKALNHTVASLLGRNPKHELNEDLALLKEMIEEARPRPSL